MKTRIIIADDHKMMRQGLSSVLRAEPDMEVVAEAENGREAVQAARACSADVVIMDISMADLNGIDATRQIMAHEPGTKVVALSMHSDRQFVIEMLRAGAAGYVLKDAAVDELSEVIRQVMRGESFVSPKIHGLAVAAGMAEAKSAVQGPRLTTREREVLQLMSEGKGTKEIAAELSLSVKTVETHRQHLMVKLDLYTVAELTKYAIREGLTSLHH